jgi:Leucine-rich repeat (LRR) protein
LKRVTKYYIIIPLLLLIPAFTGLGGSINVDPYEDNMFYSHSIFATNTVRISNNAIINSGNVGVMNTREAVQADSLFSDTVYQENLHVDSDVYFEVDTSIYADSVFLERGASVYNIYCNELTGEGEIRGETGILSEQVYDIYLPEYPEPQSGTEDFYVSWGERRTLPPGNYGTVLVSLKGTLVLTGGIYHFENLVLGSYGSRVLVQGPVEIVIKNHLLSFIKGYIGPDEGCDISAKDIVIYAYGEDGQYGFFRGYPKTVQLGRYSEIFANIYAPNGTLWIRRDSVVKGAFVGRDVLVDFGAEVTLDSFKPQGLTTQFADPNLEEAVREALGKPDGPLYVTDLGLLSTLNASGRDIEDLRGIEDCVNLISLVLEYNNISDIQPLSALVNLLSLNLNDNDVSDISPIAGLTNLSRLYLGGNSLSNEDVPHLENLINLSYLALDYNSITDIKTLAHLTNLQSLVLNNNVIKDISPLGGLTNLRVLYLNNNAISEITALTDLTNLSVLYLYSNDIYDITPLRNLTSLVNLVLDYNRIDNITPLMGLHELTVLYLNVNHIHDISPLAGLDNLEILVLDTNDIDNISALSSLTNITQLYLGENRISDISPLAGLYQLNTLYVHSNNIDDISALVTNCDVGGLGMDDEVYLFDNPLEGDDVDEDIEYLTSKGVRVYWYSSFSY